MIRPEVVAYLQENLSRFPAEDLRKQLAAEGISETDWQDSLAAALRAPKTATQTKTVRKPSGPAAKIFLGSGLALILGVGLFALSQKPAEPEKPSKARALPDGESGYIGQNGWVVRLPKDYEGVSAFKDPAKTRQVVHFSKRGTDPTNFLNEGLFGQMGIVRLEVMPSPFPANPIGLANMSRGVSARLDSHGEKYILKNIQVATLPGLQVNVQSPFPRVEAYILGQSDLYFFFAGSEDEIYRDIVLSLRDARTEN